ncbi:MAG: hypothetical protein K6G43_00315 [Lachnospiraceae bacterium]|nr:hypothetical protein [Lachnospiraceae bacterium]
MNNKRKILIFICIVSTLIILGDAFFSPKLINADKPFIELSGSVGDSIGNAQSAFAIANPVPLTVTSEVLTHYDYIIEVTLETITLNGNAYSLNDLESDIKSGEFRGKTVLLIDNYAETVTYKSVLGVLKTNNIDYKEQRK